MTEARLSAKHQIVIPRQAREALGLKRGDRLIVITRGKDVIILQKPKSYSQAIRGIGRGVYSQRHVKRERDTWN